MKILALQGSPRRQCATRDVLEMVLSAAKEAGAETEMVQLCDMVYFSGCNQCEACQGHFNEPGCCLPDDMQEVLRKAMKADVIVLATPVMNYSPAWPLKMALDRMNCLHKFGDTGEAMSLLEGRKMAAVITTGREDGEGARLVTETSQHVAESSKAQWVGALVAKEATADPKQVAQQAKEFGRRLVA